MANSFRGPIDKRVGCEVLETAESGLDSLDLAEVAHANGTGDDELKTILELPKLKRQVRLLEMILKADYPFSATLMGVQVLITPQSPGNSSPGPDVADRQPSPGDGPVNSGHFGLQLPV